MISQARLSEIVAEQIAQGKNADQISKATGVPVERIQATIYRLRGVDPAQAKRHTRKKRRQQDRDIFGESYISPALINGLPARGAPKRAR